MVPRGTKTILQHIQCVKSGICPCLYEAGHFFEPPPSKNSPPGRGETYTTRAPRLADHEHRAPDRGRSIAHRGRRAPAHGSRATDHEHRPSTTTTDHRSEIRAPRIADHDPRIEDPGSHTKQHEPRSRARRPRAKLDRRHAQKGELETAAREQDRAVPGQARDHIPTRSNEAYLVNSQLDNEHPIAQKKGRHMGALSRSMSSRSISQSPTDRAGTR